LEGTTTNFSFFLAISATGEGLGSSTARGLSVEEPTILRVQTPTAIRLAAPTRRRRRSRRRTVGRREVIAQKLTKSREMARIHESNGWKRSTQL